MADVKISELPAASSAAGTDELPANQAGTTRKLTRAQIVAGLAASGAVTSSGLTMTTARLLGRTTASTGAIEEISVGSGLTLSAGSITNASPDQTVSIAPGTGISVTGSYPNFTVAATNNGTVTSITAGTGLTGGTITGSGTVAADVATNANIHAGAANKLVAAAEIYSASAPVTSSGSGNHAFNFNAGRTFARTLTGNSTLTNPTNQVAGQGGIIYIIQDATGGRTLSYGADWKPIGGAPTIVTTANAINVFSYYVRSSTNITLSYLGAQA